MSIVRISFLYSLYFLGALYFAATWLHAWPFLALVVFIFGVPWIFVWFHHSLTSKNRQPGAKPTQRRKDPKGLTTHSANAAEPGKRTKPSDKVHFNHKPGPHESTERVVPTEVSFQFGQAKEKQRTNTKTQRGGWVPRNQSVSLAGRALGGMIYFGPSPRLESGGYGQKCKPYVDPSLSVASKGSDRNGEDMPYWPGYSEISPTCRTTYLDWLSSGRSDGSVNPGYMFLYFYGLERRFIVEESSEAEKAEILREVIRLKEIFKGNHSAQRYLGDFIDLAKIILSDSETSRPIFKNWGWDLPLSIKFSLGQMVANDVPISSEWMLSWFLCHNEKRIRTPAQRCEVEFFALFKLRFEQQFPQGLRLPKPKRHLELNYRAASGEFEEKLPLYANGQPVLDVSSLRKPLDTAQVIADSAMDELEKLSRFLGRNPDGRNSLEGHALLPVDLRRMFPSSELDKLREWLLKVVVAGGVIQTEKLVARLEGVQPDKVSKRQLSDAADTLARIGFGMAPDARYSLRGPKPDEPVVIFEIGEIVEKLEDVSENYKSALLEVALAALVAHSDSKVVDAEAVHLRRKVENLRGLSLIEAKQLSANLDWYLAIPPNMAALKNQLENRTPQQQKALREAVVSMAHADGIIQSEEVVNIGRIYKALGLNQNLVYSDLHAGGLSNGPVRVRSVEIEASGEAIPRLPNDRIPSLGAERIAAIRSDTDRVSAILGEIFADEGDAEEETKRIGSTGNSFEGLDVKHSTLVRSLIERKHWSPIEFSELVKSNGLMPEGALEVVNEFAFEHFDEALLEEYDGYDVSSVVADAMRATTKGRFKNDPVETKRT